MIESQPNLRPFDDDDYLFSGEGPVDATIAELEAKLAPLRYRPPATDWLRAQRVFSGSNRGALLAAAAILIMVTAVSWVQVGLPDSAAWSVRTLAGTATIDSADLSATGQFAVGQWLETGARSRVRVDVADIGGVTVHENSRLRLLRSEALREHRLQLAQGKIEAFIFAPPRLFFVDTPSAIAVDYGCQYTLEVDESGAGRLEVTLGWVSFEDGDRRSFVPRGAVCLTEPEHGPGTPFFADATAAFREALRVFDFEPGRETALDVILDHARPRDALTLWHLLTRVENDQIGLVYDRLAEFRAPPDGVKRQGILRGNRPMLERWRRDLNYLW